MAKSGEADDPKAEDILPSAVRSTDYVLISLADPTDESVGYYHSSAKRGLGAYGGS